MAIDIYKSLAWKVYRRYNHLQLKRLLEDPEIIVDLILEELWDLDFYGVWLDTIFQDLKLLKDKEWINTEMRHVAEAMADKIDTERLRESLLSVIDEMGGL